MGNNQGSGIEVDKIIYIFSNINDRLTVDVVKYFLEHHLENIVVTSVFDAQKENQSYKEFFERSIKMAIESDIIVSLKPDIMDWGNLIEASKKGIPILHLVEHYPSHPWILNMITAYYAKQNDLIIKIKALLEGGD